MTFLTDGEHAAAVAHARTAAAEVFLPEGVDLFMMGRNRILDGRTPLEAISDGDFERVLDCIEMLASGAVW